MTVITMIPLILSRTRAAHLALSTFQLFTLPNFFTRVLATGVADILVSFLFILSLMLLNGVNLLTIKILLVFCFIAFTNPFGTNIIMIAAAHKKNYLDYNETEVLVKDEEE